MDMKIQNKKDVIPAEAGIQQVIESYIPNKPLDYENFILRTSLWLFKFNPVEFSPAFAGMTRMWDSNGILPFFSADEAKRYATLFRRQRWYGI